VVHNSFWSHPFDFADFSAINQAIEEMYGARGGRGLNFTAESIRTGRPTVGVSGYSTVRTSSKSPFFYPIHSCLVK
jgi:hypothetical protein